MVAGDRRRHDGQRHEPGQGGERPHLGPRRQRRERARRRPPASSARAGRVTGPRRPVPSSTTASPTVRPVASTVAACTTPEHAPGHPRLRRGVDGARGHVAHLELPGPPRERHHERPQHDDQPVAHHGHEATPEGHPGTARRSAWRCGATAAATSQPTHGARRVGDQVVHVEQPVGARVYAPDARELGQLDEEGHGEPDDHGGRQATAPAPRGAAPPGGTNRATFSTTCSSAGLCASSASVAVPSGAHVVDRGEHVGLGVAAGARSSGSGSGSSV